MQEFVDKIKKEPAYLAVEKNVSGSRPKELFDDCIEEIEGEFTKDRTVLKDAIKEHSIEIVASSTFDEFLDALRDANVELDSIITPNRYCHDIEAIVPVVLSVAVVEACTLGSSLNMRDLQVHALVERELISHSETHITAFITCCSSKFSHHGIIPHHGLSLRHLECCTVPPATLHPSLDNRLNCGACAHGSHNHPVYRCLFTEGLKAATDGHPISW